MSSVLPPHTSSPSSKPIHVLSSTFAPASQGAGLLSNPEYSSMAFHLYGGAKNSNILFNTENTLAFVQPYLDLKDSDKNGLTSKALVNNTGVVVLANSHAKDNKKDFSNEESSLPVINLPVMFGQDKSKPPIIKYQPSESILNYSSHDNLLQEANFDVPVSSLDGYLGINLPAQIKLSNIIDDKLSQDNYIDADLRLSPSTFTSSRPETFVINETPVSITSNTSANGTLISTSLTGVQAKLPDLNKLLIKGKTGKSLSPSRQGNQPCQVCGKVFNNSSALTKHKLTHSDERKYVCQLCTKAFKRQDHLNGHMLTHRQKKPYGCDAEGCGKSYCDARSLRRHKENHHSNNGLTGNKFPVQARTVSAISNLAGTLKPFPTSVITSTTTSIVVKDPIGAANRIQYAPPLAQSISTQLLTLQKPKTDIWQTQTINQSRLVSHGFVPAQNTLCQTTNFVNSSLSTSKEVEVPSEDSEPSNMLLNADAKDSSPAPSEGYMSSPANVTQSASDLSSRTSDNFPSQESQTLLSVPESSGDTSHLGSPLLQQLLNTSQQVGNILVSNLASQKPCLSTSVNQDWNQMPYALLNSDLDESPSKDDDKAVECSICLRKFKNVPALNGHMRLHGGYFKKEIEDKKPDKASNGPVASHTNSSIRALIESKINQKKEQASLLSVFDTNSQDTGLLDSPPAPEDDDPFTPDHVSPHATSVFDFSLPSQNEEVFSNSTCNETSLQIDLDWQKGIEALKAEFRIPRPPPVEKFRRHSDSDHSLAKTKPCASYTNNMLSDYLLRRKVAKRMTRTGSDPGEPLFSGFYNSDEPLMSTTATNEDLSSNFNLASSLDGATNDLSNDLVQASDLNTLGTDEQNLMLLEEQIGQTSLDEYTGMLAQDSIVPNCSNANMVDSIFENSDLNLSDMDSYFYSTSTSLASTNTSTTTTISSLLPATTTIMNTVGIKEEEDSNDDVFLSPIPVQTSPKRNKRKHKPEPLYIPPYVSTHGYASRLRSPCLWDPDTKKKHTTPPPYTPPPMLSPVRTGPGLFWQAISSSGNLTPKSSPSIGVFGSSLNKSVSLSESADEPETPKLETNVTPHVNVGKQYQAKLPKFNPNVNEAFATPDHADKLWDPCSTLNLTDEEVDDFLNLSCCNAVPGGGRNKELAFHLLQLHQGDILEALRHMMQPCLGFPRGHPLQSYQYPESDTWSPDEIESFHQGLKHYDKDFSRIAKDVSTKSVKQCVQFYYLWKKVCVDDYRKIRLNRRKKEPPPETIYNFEDSISDNVMETSKLDLIETTSYVSSEADITYPCKYCGKIFLKVKSRNSHMKIHSEKKYATFT